MQESTLGMDKFNAIVFGESGVGKTAMAGTLQSCIRTSPCLFLDVDMGTLCLDGMKERPTVLPVETWSQVGLVYKRLKDGDWKGLAEYIGKVIGREVPVLEYRSVVIDSGTELEYKLRSEVVSEEGKQEIPSQPDYLKTQERYRRMYRSFRDLPLSLVVTAGIRELKEESTGIVKRSPDFQPSLAHDVVRMTDLVIYMSVTMEGAGSEAKWTRHLITSLSQRFVARDRSGKLPAVMSGDKFYWNDILKRMFGNG